MFNNQAIRLFTTSDQVDCGSPALLDDLQYSTVFCWLQFDPAASDYLRIYQKC